MKKTPKPAPFRPKLDDKLAALPNPSPSERAEYAPDVPQLDPTLVAAVVGEARREHQQRAQRHDVRGSGGIPTSAERSENELLVVMASRLRTLEAQVTSLREELLTKEAELRRLRRNRTSTEELMEDHSIVSGHNVQLMKQLLDMKSWLKQNRIPYEGMVPSWAGSLEEDEPHQQKEPETDLVLLSAPSSASGRRQSANSSSAKGLAIKDAPGEFNWQTTFADPAPSPSNVPDMRKIQHHVRQLNASITEHVEIGTQLATGAVVHKFQDRKPVIIVMYRDGLCVNSGPFRPYHWPAGQAVVQDLLDGYYPYELKQSHPDGVPLEIVDKTTEDCPKDAKDGGKVATLQSAHDRDRGYHQIEKGAFLQKIPKSVVKNGQLIEVRAEIDSLLGGNKALGAPVVVKTEALAQKTKQDGSGNAPEQQITTIQVKCPAALGGSELVVFVVHLFYQQTIGELRRAIEQQVRERDSLRGTPFQLCTTFPQRVFSDDSQTLKLADLVPTATVFVRFQQL